jgi:hypothetical protein
MVDLEQKKVEAIPPFIGINLHEEKQVVIL